MKVSLLICTHGDEGWREFAYSIAYQSAKKVSGYHEVLVEHESAATLAEIRNHAAEHASGDWLCYLDADDELCPDYLDQMRAAMRHWNLARRRDLELNPLLLAPAVQYCRDGVAQAGPDIPNKGRWPDSNECVIGTLVPRRMFAEVGGFRELPSLEDYDLWLRCVRAGAKIVHVPDAVYVAHMTPGSRNSDQTVYDQLREEHAEVWAAHAPVAARRRRR